MQNRAKNVEERPPVGLHAAPLLILPRIYGTTAKDSYWTCEGSGNWLESAAPGYAGLVTTLFLAPLAWADPRHRRSLAASTFIRRNRAKIRQLVSKWTGEYQLTLDALLDDMMVRCRELNLRAVGPERQLVMEFTVLLTAKTVHALFGLLRRKWIAL